MHRTHPNLRTSLLRTNLRQILGLIALGLTIVAVLTGLSFLHFNRKMYQVVYAQNMSSVSQLAGYFTRAFDTKIDACFQILENAELLIEPEQQLLEDEVVDQLEKAVGKTGFTDMGVVDLSGNVRNTNGASTNIAGMQFVQDVLSGNRYISDAHYSDDTLRDAQLLLAIPMRQNNTVVGLLYGRYPIADILSDVEADTDSTCYFQIIDSQGHYITRSNSGNAWADDTTDLSTELQRYDYHDTTTADQILENIEQGKSGTFYCTYQGDGRYGSYQPIGINQWYVFSMLPEQNIVESASAMRQISLHMLVQILLCLLAGGLIPLLYVWRVYYMIREKNTTLEIHNRMFQLVLQKTKDIPFEADLPRREVILHSPRFPGGSQTLSLDDIHPMTLYNAEMLDQACYDDYERAYADLMRATTGKPTVVRLRMLGEMTWFKIMLLDVYRLGSDTRVVGVLENYEEQKQKDQEIELSRQQAIHLSHRSQHDFLTGLFNRETLEEWVNLYLSQSPPRMQAFLILDLDHFKEINDTMGHTKGDEVLRDVADTLKHQFRRDDIIARLGGDEFVILLKNLDSDAVIEKLATALGQALRKTYTQGDQTLSISASIGIARAPVDGTTFAELYPKADQALYAVKRRGKDDFQIYHPT